MPISAKFGGPTPSARVSCTITSTASPTAGTSALRSLRTQPLWGAQQRYQTAWGRLDFFSACPIISRHGSAPRALTNQLIGTEATHRTNGRPPEDWRSPWRFVTISSALLIITEESLGLSTRSTDSSA